MYQLSNKLNSVFHPAKHCIAFQMSRATRSEVFPQSEMKAKEKSRGEKRNYEEYHDKIKSNRINLPPGKAFIL